MDRLQDEKGLAKKRDNKMVCVCGGGGVILCSSHPDLISQIIISSDAFNRLQKKK